MKKTLTIKDETPTGQILHEISLAFQSEYISVRELIEARILKEISKYESQVKNYKNHFIQPTDIEQRLNNKKPLKPDPEKQLYVALDAFQKNGFFILVDNEQVEDLNQRFLVDNDTLVSFIKLTPLVGG